jgi:FkbM family methyltransferase
MPSSIQQTRAVTPPTFTEIDFITHLTSELLTSCQRREHNNVDRVRFPRPRSSFKIPSRSSLVIAIKDKVIELAESRGFYRASAIHDDLLKRVLKNNELARAYNLFQDQISRDLFVKLLAFRILGYRHVRLPLNQPQYWEVRESLSKYVEKRDTITQIPILGSLDLCRVGKIALHTHALGILNVFLLEQYQCPRANVGVRSGDVVIDAGGCWGDTALYFAQNAAQVFCFECIPSNITIIQENLGLNPASSAKIRVIKKALWNRSGEKLVFNDSGPGSQQASNGLGVAVETQTLDDFVSANSLARIDFIKMDIEGSEPEALSGAEQTIRKHRPQLAISVYHDLNHFGSIPNWLAGLNLGYRLYLDHFTIHQEETVLFARCDS